MTPQEQLDHLKVLLSDHLVAIDEKVAEAKASMDAETDMEAKRMYMEYIKGMYHLRHNVTMQYANTQAALREAYGI